MANITTNDNIVDKHGRTKALNNDFWRAFVSNIPTGTATLSPDGVSDTTKYLQHLNGIFVGETDGTVYLGHGLQGNVNNAFNGINCGTLATGNFNYTSSGRQNLTNLTSGNYNSVGAGYGNLTSLTTGSYNHVGTGINNLKSLTTGNGNVVGAGVENLLYCTNGSNNYIGAGGGNLKLLTSGSNNMIGAGQFNLHSLTTGNFNYVGSGWENLRNQTTASENSVGAGHKNAYSNTTGTNIHVGAGYQNLYKGTTGTNNYVGAGRDCFYENTIGSFNAAGVGFEVFRYSNHSHQTGSGYKAGKNLIGSNNTSYGSLSNFLSDAVALSSKTYTVSTNKTITSTSHGFTVGSIVTFQNQLGTLSNTASPFYFKVLDVDTLETHPNSLTNLTVAQSFTGTAVMATVVDYTNASAFGYATKNTKSNQVALGDSNVTELLLGGTLAIDKASLVGAADGTPIVIRTIGGVKTITV